MAGKSARVKGNRVERKVVAWLKEIGLVARKVPLSGATADFKDDIEIDFPRQTDKIRAEVKARKSPPPWKTIKSWLGEADLLFLVEDREDPLVVMPAVTFENLVAQITAGAVAQGINDGTHHPVQLPESERGWD